MRKSIFFTTRLPKSNSISTAHIATKIGETRVQKENKKLAAQMTAWITIILIIITLLAILYAIFKKCRYVSSLPRVCFPLYPFSTILRGTACTDIFVEVVNLASAEAMWGAFCIRRSPPFAVKDHRLSPRLRHAYYKNFVAADSSR